MRSGSAHVGMFTYAAALKRSDPLPVTVFRQIQKPRANIQRSVVLLKLLMLELKDRFRIVDALKKVVRREACEDCWGSHTLDLPTVHQFLRDGSDYCARISLGQCHGAVASHLGCERLQVVRLLAEDWCRLQRISVFVSLFLQAYHLGEDADFRGGDFGAGLEQRGNFRQDERSPCQLFERRIPIDARAEFGGFRAKASFQVICPLLAAKAQQS